MPMELAESIVDLTLEGDDARSPAPTQKVGGLLPSWVAPAFSAVSTLSLGFHFFSRMLQSGLHFPKMGRFLLEKVGVNTAFLIHWVRMCLPTSMFCLVLFDCSGVGVRRVNLLRCSCPLCSFLHCTRRRMWKLKLPMLAIF